MSDYRASTVEQCTLVVVHTRTLGMRKHYSSSIWNTPLSELYYFFRIHDGAEDMYSLFYFIDNSSQVN